jgi:hypothetical protein
VRHLCEGWACPTKGMVARALVVISVHRESSTDTMGHLGTPLHHLRKGAICAALFAAFLVLSAVSLVSTASIDGPRPSPSLLHRDTDAKALRPQQQLAIRGSSRSVRLGASGDFGAIRAVLQGALPVPRRTAFVALALPARGYLAQRTRCPREPPQAEA